MCEVYRIRIKTKALEAEGLIIGSSLYRALVSAFCPNKIEQIQIRIERFGEEKEVDEHDSDTPF